MTKPITVASERALLTKHLDWCAEQPWVDEMYDDLQKLHARLRSQNHTGPAPADGTCWVVADGEICGGSIRRTEQMRTVWKALDDRCAADTAAVPDGPLQCQRCGTTWAGDVDEARALAILEAQAVEAGRPRTADGRAMRTARELAEDHGVRLPAMRKRLLRMGVKAHDRQWYDPQDLNPTIGVEATA